MKQYALDIDGARVQFEVRKRKGMHRLVLSVRQDGCVRVTVPWYVTVRMAERFVESKASWLRSVLARSTRATVPMSATERAQHFTTHREEARRFIHARLPAFGMYYGVTWGRVTIRNTVSRWGSASRAGNLNFNYRVLFLPPHLAEYVLVHELCHLRELNHSPRFWALVAETIPDWKERRRALRRVSMTALMTSSH